MSLLSFGGIVTATLSVQTKKKNYNFFSLKREHNKKKTMTWCVALWVWWKERQRKRRLCVSCFSGKKQGRADVDGTWKTQWSDGDLCPSWKDEALFPIGLFLCYIPHNHWRFTTFQNRKWPTTRLLYVTHCNVVFLEASLPLSLHTVSPATLTSQTTTSNWRCGDSMGSCASHHIYPPNHKACCV